MSIDRAVRDGWWISLSGRGPWWALREREGGLRYGLTMKRGDYHIELGGNDLAELKREAAKLARGPLPTPRGTTTRFTRDWWARQRRGEFS